jgi:hypothetical protein
MTIRMFMGTLDPSLKRQNLSSSAAAISLPSWNSAAEESAWKAFRPNNHCSPEFSFAI